ncbi:MAG: ABC transporter ATP-binding protein [Gammaproteobacteria bacterium]
MIEVAGLNYEYPGRRALSGVGFSIAAGSITALVGPNGAGKTTLLRCLAGMDRPLTGRIAVNGVDVVEHPRQSHAHIGYLSDAFGLYPRLSVRQSLTYVARANGVAPADTPARVTTTAAELGLAERLDQPTGELSRGLKQRVAIAQAIIHGPTVVLLDEPASGLDPEARIALGELFVALRERGLTLVVSSHILAELESYSTHMLILRDGRVVEHRTLGVSAGRTQSLEIETNGDPAALLTWLRARPELQDVRAAGARVQCTAPAAADARAALLATLIEAGFAVCHFAPLPKDLQRSYLASLQREVRA